MHAVIPRAGGAFSSVTDTVLSGIAGAEAEIMRYEEDYVRRMLEDAIEVVMRIALNKKGPFYKLEEENRYGSEDGLYSRILKMADAGQINEAENLLWEALEEKSADHLETGLAFYYHINEFEDEFLLANHYSRDEIRDGLRNMLREYEIDDSIFMSELE